MAYPSWFDWPTIEADALMLATWQPQLVDGLLQSEAYAAAILRGNQQAIETRLARQAILTRDEPPPPAYNLLLEESVLYREVGDPGVMREQLTRLAAQISDRITVQIVPSRGEHDGNSGPFILAKMDDMSEVAYVDTVAHGLTMGEPDELAAVHKALMEIRALAYPVRESVQIINRVVEERWT